MTKYVNLGKTGLKVSRITLGTMTYGSRKLREWVLEEEESRPFIKLALDLGINFFDTADVYSLGTSEEIVGRALKDFAQRDQVVIATKVHGKVGDGPNDKGLSRKHIFDSIDASLRRLQTDYVDLYQIHRWDYETPIEETLEALHDIVKAGKVRYLGISSVFAWQLAKALYTADIHGWTRFVSIQNHYNLVYREEEREVIPLALDQGLGIIPWSPLARGFLAGNRSKSEYGETLRAKTDEFAHNLYYQDSDFQVVNRVVELAGKRGVKPTQIALAWLLHQPGVTSPIIGASKIEHLKEAAEAVDLELSQDELKFLEEPYTPHPILGHQYPSGNRP
ncbi:aldo/keto reductase [Tolypothrix tenuis PCC 7101]|uniref:Aldo/keto reductase n=1 Tax=Tolypothrix tenuis PCC 7101 TaxID=231146 RepID=A0A1Z4NA14_9CYAN|nr:aldo/keto reductase [Aulosira sp. FACHB-113]BAZ02551.1 aldo/keto reductase [Tolypothrix tenuis PCC 7101]BAZ73528.1 aldo/keto reductase [Aulosira laxa NIES-50]